MREVYDAIRVEREVQDQEWGQAHDDANTPFDWVLLLARHLGKLSEARIHSYMPKPDLMLLRNRLVSLAALCIAAIEAIDRKIERLQ